VTTAEKAPAVRLTGVNKTFGAVRANRDVNLTVQAGTIHGIIGENGAGKSTLVSILYGFYTADSGTVEIDGQRVDIANSAEAIDLGVGMVHQHFMLVPNFSVLENVMLGAEGGGMLAAGVTATRERLLKLEQDHGLEVDPDAIVGELPVGLQQRVEILKALNRGARILILDEPTGVLTPDETDQLFEILRALRAEGVTILLITHKLREIMGVTDAVSVMRQGQMVAHRETQATSREELAELMVGRKVNLQAGPKDADPGRVMLSASGLNFVDEGGAPRLLDVGLELRRGEILGVAGVAGNGQSELLELLSGVAPLQSGEIVIDDRRITRSAPVGAAEMRALGVAHVPEDRHRRGLVLPFDARENAILGYHRGALAGDGVFLDKSRMQQNCSDLMDRFDVRPPDPSLRAAGFSGGNQQKVVLAREITSGPKVLLVGQPTRGVDIGAIEFIHKQIQGLKEAGCAILLVSVELDEIMALADRIMVMNAGRVVGVLPRAEVDTQKLGLMMAGVGAVA
jgi:simple sugar transport system ATP-binding protein